MNLSQFLILAGCVLIALTQVEVIYRWLDKPPRTQFPPPRKETHDE